ncbi:hypothetical protein IWX49DRAFT_103624 [Phyllosticta citricarpa]|uniref:Secreted protein n=1 Tax=Phyllosticta citricarpa TaxID=55181 RepID=A0ABR1MRK1_9PEZI
MDRGFWSSRSVVLSVPLILSAPLNWHSPAMLIIIHQAHIATACQTTRDKNRMYTDVQAPQSIHPPRCAPCSVLSTTNLPYPTPPHTANPPIEP